MTIDQIVYAALMTVHPNSHAVELPDNPVWPALVFETSTEEEPGWVLGGGYEQHDVVVSILAKTKDEIGVLKAALSAAFRILPGFMGNEGSADAEYQGDASVYAYVQNFRLRTRI